MSLGRMSEKLPLLMLGLPKGSLQEATIEKMAKAGFNIQVSSRSYIPYVDDDELEIRLPEPASCRPRGWCSRSAS